MKMDPFDEPMAGKGSTPMENDYLAFADSKRKAGTPWAEIPLFRDWVELRYAEVRRLREALEAIRNMLDPSGEDECICIRCDDPETAMDTAFARARAALEKQ